MKPKATLLSKILVLFFINLIVLIAVLIAFYALQSRKDILNLLGSNSGNRMRTTGHQIAFDLERSPSSEWVNIISRYEELHSVNFILITRDKTVKSEKTKTVPDKLRREISFAFRTEAQRLPRRDKEPRWDNRFKDRTRKPFRGPIFRMRTENPTMYWLGFRTFLQIQSKPRPMPVMLLARSHSLTGNGFFFDPIPWIIVAIVVVIVSVLFWIPFVRHITKPIAKMTAATEQIAKGKFDVEIEERRSDEIGRLAGAINHMTRRLSGYVKGQRRFLGDVAHELGSPIARIQFGLGILENQISETHREQLNDVLEDVTELSHLVNELLSFTKAEITPERVQLESIDLLPLVENAVQRESKEGADIRIEVPADFKVTANATLLTRALANLIRNAVRYAGDQGPIIIGAGKHEKSAEIIVRDSGKGVSDEHLEKLFDPFYRPESARDRESGGVGLGLTIVKTCVEACNGSVTARNLAPVGFAVTLTFNS